MYLVFHYLQYKIYNMCRYKIHNKHANVLHLRLNKNFSVFCHRKLRKMQTEYFNSIVTQSKRKSRLHFVQICFKWDGNIVVVHIFVVDIACLFAFSEWATKKKHFNARTLCAAQPFFSFKTHEINTKENVCLCVLVGIRHAKKCVQKINNCQYVPMYRAPSLGFR